MEQAIIFAFQFRKNVSIIYCVDSMIDKTYSDEKNISAFE